MVGLAGDLTTDVPRLEGGFDLILSLLLRYTTTFAREPEADVLCAPQVRLLGTPKRTSRFRQTFSVAISCYATREEEPRSAIKDRDR